MPTLKDRVRAAVELGLETANRERTEDRPNYARTVELIGIGVAPILDALEQEHSRELAAYRSADGNVRRDLELATAAIADREAIIERYRGEGDRLEAELADRERDLERLLAVAGAETAEEFEERLAPVDRLNAIARRLEELVEGIDSGKPRVEFLGAGRALREAAALEAARLRKPCSKSEPCETPCIDDPVNGCPYITPTN